MATASLIFLVGMPGCGKSTLGAVLANRLGYAFVDTDLLFEQKTGQTPASYLLWHSEDAFRQQEAVVLNSTLMMQQTVVATGGGTPCFWQGMDKMTQAGQVIYLQASIELLAQRINIAANPRPLPGTDPTLSLVQRLESLILRRKHDYERAQTLVPIVDNPDLNLTNLVEAVQMYI